MLGVRNTRPVLCAIGACLLLGAQAPAPAAILIGVDFDNGAGSPANWNTFNVGTPNTLVNVIDENGAATGVNFTLQNGTGFTTAANPATVPTHWNPLYPGIDDYYYATGVGSANFSNLIPGEEYYVWVFGLRGFNMNNRVTIMGGGAPIQFDQVGTAGQVWVNDQLGSSANDLMHYALVQTATGAGQISFNFDIVPGGAAGWTIAGVAVSLVPAPGTAALLGVCGLVTARRRRA